MKNALVYALINNKAVFALHHFYGLCHCDICIEKKITHLRTLRSPVKNPNKNHHRITTIHVRNPSTKNTSNLMHNQKQYQNLQPRDSTRA